MTEQALTGAFVAIALGLVKAIEVLAKNRNGKAQSGEPGKGTICVLGSESPGLEALKAIAKTLGVVDRTTTAIAGQTTELVDSHKPEGGRFRWWFPDGMTEKQEEMLAEQRATNQKLERIAGHLETIEKNGKETH